jgi:hypothetical protein
MAFDFKGYTEDQVLGMMYPAQREAFNEVLYGDNNVLLTAAGGFGKSFVIDAVKYFAKKRTVVTASTGSASVLIGGTTSHSTLALPLGVPTKINMTKTSRRYKSIFKREHPVDIIVIDEAPMIGPHTMDAVLQRLNRIQKTSVHNNVKLVMVGDFAQCLNVVKSKDREMIEELYGVTTLLDSDIFKEGCFKLIELNENKRVGDNKEFGEILEKLRLGYDKHLVCSYLNRLVGDPFEDTVYIVPRNDQADIINQKAFEDNPETSVTYFANIKGEFDLRDTQMLETLSLKKNLRVMCLTNEQTEAGEDPRYVNGSIGTVLDANWDMVRVLFDNGNDVWLDPVVQKNIEYYVDDEGELKDRVIGEFEQINLKVCYAISINKAQGVSLEKANIDFGDKGCFNYGQAYTAISRMTNPEGLRLITPIYPSDILVHRTVKRFYEGLRGIVQPFRVIVAGSRGFNDYNLLKLKLDSLLRSKTDEEVVIVSGGAYGADQLGERYAKERGYEVHRYIPYWDRLGKRAGFVRNTEMADNADALVLFWDGESRGSEHMLNIAKERYLSVRVINY